MKAPPAENPTRRRFLGVAAAVVTAGALAFVHATLNPRPPGLPDAPFRDAGRRLGQEAAQLAQGGARIVLIARDTTTQFQTPAYAAMAAGVEEAVGKAGQKLATSRLLKVDPLRVVSVPPGEYLELYRRLEDRDVIVSLLGPPVLDAGQLAALGPKRPKVLALCSGNLPRQVDLKQLLEAGLLHTALIHRPGQGKEARAFDQMFQVVTAANTADLPLPAGSQP
ncbi:MAG: hypothetical protein RJA22_2731 [Verrucomicrobiota bacterium]